MIILTALLIESTTKSSTCFFKILNYCDVVSSQHVIIIFLSNFLTYYGHKGLAEIVKTSHYYKKKSDSSLSLLVRDKVDTIIYNFSSHQIIWLSKENKVKAG